MQKRYFGKRTFVHITSHKKSKLSKPFGIIGDSYIVDCNKKYHVLDVAVILFGKKVDLLVRVAN